MSWRDILKEEIDWMKHYQKSLDGAKSKSKASLSPDDRGKVNFILREAEKALNRLKTLDELDGSEVVFEELMDSLSYYL